MSARSSRLRLLERGLKAPSKSRAKARALTVMRLEGGTSAGQSSPARPARLPQDMEDQIAVVRGRAVGKPSRGLLQLEERLLQPRAAGSTAVVQRHDHGAMPVSAAPVSQARSFSASRAVSEFGGAYNVESFEDSATITAPKQISPAPVPAGTISAPAVPSAPATEVTRCADPRMSISPAPVSESQPPDRATRRSALTADQEAVAASFERDIAAMLGTSSPASTPENQQWDDAVRNATNASTATPQTPAVTAPQPTTTPKRDEHDVFNQMGVAMNYANSFDLGAMDLSAQFDRFDEELALAPPAKTPVTAAFTATTPRIPVQALALDDFDLVEDLAEISGAQPAPAPAPATAPAPAPASEPCVTKEDASTATPPPPAPSPQQH